MNSNNDTSHFSLITKFASLKWKNTLFYFIFIYFHLLLFFFSNLQSNYFWGSARSENSTAAQFTREGTRERKRLKDRERESERETERRMRAALPPRTPQLSAPRLPAPLLGSEVIQLWPHPLSPGCSRCRCWGVPWCGVHSSIWCWLGPDNPGLFYRPHHRQARRYQGGGVFLVQPMTALRWPADVGFTTQVSRDTHSISPDALQA